MPSSLSFQVNGKKPFHVRRAGSAGTGNEIRIIFTITRRRWRGVRLDLGKNSAEWHSFTSRINAQGWIQSTGSGPHEREI